MDRVFAAIAATVVTAFPSGKAHSFRGGMKARQDAECQ
jgi:hypothetical protein